MGYLSTAFYCRYRLLKKSAVEICSRNEDDRPHSESGNRPIAKSVVCKYPRPDAPSLRPLFEEKIPQGWETMNLTIRSALVENSQQPAHQQDQQNGAKPYACASACTPPVVAVISAAPAKNQHQNNNQNDESHPTSPSLRVPSPGLCHLLDRAGCLPLDDAGEESAS